MTPITQEQMTALVEAQQIRNGWMACTMENETNLPPWLGKNRFYLAVGLTEAYRRFYTDIWAWSTKNLGRGLE